MPEPQQLMNLSRYANGQFTGASTPDRTKGSLKARAKAVLEEEVWVEEEDGTRHLMTRAERVARALENSAAAGRVDAAKLLADLTEEKHEQGDWQVTIVNVKQQIVALPDNQLVPPPSSTLSQGTDNTD